MIEIDPLSFLLGMAFACGLNFVVFPWLHHIGYLRRSGR
jgi:hypothetical protein